MDNPLSKYINADLTESIQSFTVKSGTSKEGQPYCYLELTLINGYKARIFANSDATFAYSNAFELLELNK